MTTAAEVKIDTKKEFKKPIRVEGDKIIYNDDPLIYVIEDFITEEECKHFVAASDSKLERAKTIGGKDGIYHENQHIKLINISTLLLGTLNNYMVLINLNY